MLFPQLKWTDFRGKIIAYHRHVTSAPHSASPSPARQRFPHDNQGFQPILVSLHVPVDSPQRTKQRSLIHHQPILRLGSARQGYFWSPQRRCRSRPPVFMRPRQAEIHLPVTALVTRIRGAPPSRPNRIRHPSRFHLMYIRQRTYFPSQRSKAMRSRMARSLNASSPPSRVLHTTLRISASSRPPLL